MSDLDRDPGTDDLTMKSWWELTQLRESTIREGFESDAGQLRDLSLDMEVLLERMREGAIVLRSLIATGRYADHSGALTVVADYLDLNADGTSALVFMLDEALDDAGVPDGVLKDVAAD